MSKEACAVWPLAFQTWRKMTSKEWSGFLTTQLFFWAHFPCGNGYRWTHSSAFSFCPQSLMTNQLIIVRLIYGKNLERELTWRRGLEIVQMLYLDLKDGALWKYLKKTRVSVKHYSVSVHLTAFWGSTLAWLSHSTASGISDQILCFIIQPQASLMAIRSLIILIRNKYKISFSGVFKQGY